MRTRYSYSISIRNRQTAWMWGIHARSLGVLASFGTKTVGAVRRRATQARTLVSQQDGRSATRARVRSRACPVPLTIVGHNSSGQIGDGRCTSRTSLMRASKLTGIQSVAAGARHRLALTSDRSLSGWRRQDSRPSRRHAGLADYQHSRAVRRLPALVTTITSPRNDATSLTYNDSGSQAGLLQSERSAREHHQLRL